MRTRLETLALEQHPSTAMSLKAYSTSKSNNNTPVLWASKTVNNSIISTQTALVTVEAARARMGRDAVHA